MKGSIYVTLILMILTGSMFAQNVGINDDGSPPDNSAIVDVKSNTKGFLIPRMTTAQREAITSPADGLLIYNTTTKCFNYYSGGSWKSFCGAIDPNFQCGMKITDSRDGRMYNTVKNGLQCWMAENLNVGTRIDGTLNQTNNNTIEKYCYDNLESNCDTYGGLYQWDEAMQYATTEGVKGICPNGWHLPSAFELTILTDLYGGDEYAGGALKGEGWHQHPGCDYGFWYQESHFNALPSGCRLYDNGSFDGLNYYTVFWTSSQYNASSAWIRSIDCDFPSAFPNYNEKTYGYSVRCLQD